MNLVLPFPRGSSVPAAFAAGGLLACAACSEIPVGADPDPAVTARSAEPVVPVLANASGEDVLLSKNFRFEMDGRELEVLRVDPGPMTTDLVEVTGGDRPDNRKEFTGPEVRFGNWTVVAELSVLDGLLQRAEDGGADGALLYLDRQSNEVRRIDVRGARAVPGTFTVQQQGNEATVASVELSVEGIRQHASRTPSPSGVGPGRCGVAEPTPPRRRFRKEPGPILRKRHEPAPDRTTAEQTGPRSGGDRFVAPVSRFGLDLLTHSGAGPDENWFSVEGGGVICHSSDRATGGEGGVRAPERGRFSEVEVVGPLVPGAARAELLDWLNGWIEGERRRARSSLRLVPADAENPPEARSVGFAAGVPLEYAPPSVDVRSSESLEERFTFKPMRTTEASG